MSSLCALCVLQLRLMLIVTTFKMGLFIFLYFYFKPAYRLKVCRLTFISFHFFLFKTLSLSLVISTRYQLYKQYCGQCCRRSLFLLGLDYQTAKKTTLESQEANSSLLCLQVELYTKGNGVYAATHLGSGHNWFSILRCDKESRKAEIWQIFVFWLLSS